MSLIQAYRNRGKTVSLTITDPSGTLVPAAADKLRVVIGREGKIGGVNFADAQFFVDSDAATANGSTITPNTSTGVNTLRLDASDLRFAAGLYTLFFDFFDNSDGSEWKNVDRQVFNLEDTGDLES